MNWGRAIPVLLLPALAALFYTFQRMDSSNAEAPAAAPAELPRYTLNGAELSRYDSDGSLNLSGQADSIDYFDDQSGRASNLRVDLVSDDDKTWHLSAPAASLPAHQRRFMLEGPVLADGEWPDNGEALSLRTEHLWVDPDRRQIDTDAAVDLRSPTRSGSGQGMRSDWAGQSMQLLHNVKMNYQAPSHEAEH